MDLDTEDILAILTSIIALASAITAVTGTPDPKTRLGKVYKILEFLALVIYRAKEKGDVKKSNSKNTD